MAALIYLVETLLSLCLVTVLLRLLLQWSRADFRNPLARSIVHLTNPDRRSPRLHAAGADSGGWIRRRASRSSYSRYCKSRSCLAAQRLRSAAGVDMAATRRRRDPAYDVVDLPAGDLHLRAALADRTGHLLPGPGPAGIAAARTGAACPFRPSDPAGSADSIYPRCGRSSRFKRCLFCCARCADGGVCALELRCSQLHRLPRQCARAYKKRHLRARK